MPAIQETELPRGVKPSTGMMIDGIFASEAIDSSGEVLDVKGADISDLEDGKAVLNYEHRGDDAPGASPNDIVGKIVYAKKIFDEKDCDNERQRMYWRKIELPFIYGICRLYDAAGHPGAIAAAAAIRDHVANKEPILARYSIEGSTLDRDGQRLTHTVARRVALTMKPCNRSCDSGLLADPQAPEGFKTASVKPVDKLEHLAEKFEHPGYSKLGYGPEFEKMDTLPEDLGKAISAGSYNAAPGSLSGGAALQVEDPDLRKRAMLNQARAALRDWDQSSDFRKFVKFRLPEADPEFIDRFVGLVDDYQLKKKDPKLAGEHAAKVAKGPLTRRGKMIPPTPAVDRPAFDERTGTLHTKRGSFPMYIPSRDPDPRAREVFHNAMADTTGPAAKVYEYALKNWKKAHHLLKTGKLPEQVVMHAALFSMLSPNTPVPMQELMYGHLVDTMRATGVDARSPKFTRIKGRWMGRDKPNAFPELAPSHWSRLDKPFSEGGVRIQDDSDKTGRRKGDIGAFMLANDKFTNMSEYHKMHQTLLDLVKKHGADARSASNELMQMKALQENWKTNRRTDKKLGRADRGPYPGVPVLGLAPKTTRYAWGMMGGGNVIVPDTHFVRHLFGLDKGQDTESIDYLKSLLWNEKNSPLLEGIDRYYGQNHDAMKHIHDHPLMRDSNIAPGDRMFPAFWKHWTAIVPHEDARGMRTMGYNEATDHRPFWEAILDHIGGRVQKTDLDAWSQATTTAKEHLHWLEELGEVPAQMMFFAYLLPRLLGNSYEMAVGAPPESDSTADFAEVGSQYAQHGDPNGSDLAAMVRKFEAAAIELSVRAERLSKEEPAPKSGKAPGSLGPFEYQGKKVNPGWLELNPNARRTGEPHGYAILGADEHHLHVVPAPKGIRSLEAWAPGDVQRISRLGKDSSYRVHTWPEMLDNGHVVDVDQHAHPGFVTTTAQRRLAHGFDFKTPIMQQHDARPANGSEGYWMKHPDKTTVYVKPSNRDNEFSDARREAAASNVARDVFGLGDSVPTVSLVRHPRTGREMALIKRIPGFEHYGLDKDHVHALSKAGKNGDLDKAAAMHWVLGHWDAHDGNWGLAPDKNGEMTPRYLDHGHAFADTPMASTPPPDYLMGYHALAHPQWRHPSGNPTQEMMNAEMHPDTNKWIQSISPEKLEKSMRDMGVPEQYLDAASQRLRYLHGLAGRGRPLRIGEVFDPMLMMTPEGLVHMEG